MSALTEPVERTAVLDGALTPSATRARPKVTAAVGALAVAAAAGGLAGAVDRTDAVGRSIGLVVVGWAVAAAVIGARRDEPLALLTALAAVAAGASAAAEPLSSGGTGDRVELWAGALAGALAFHLAVGLPDGRLRDLRRRSAVAAGYVAAGALCLRSPDHLRLDDVVVAMGVVALVVAIAGYTARRRAAGAVDRARLQWVGWGAVVTALVSLLALVLHQLLGWPESPGAVIAVATALVPVSLALSSFDELAIRIDRLLTHTIVVSGLVSLVAAVYLVVVLGLGDVPDDEARRLLALSMVAAMSAAALALPARRRLDDFANRRVYGEQRSPEEALTTFGSRMSRAVPMDELLLQLAETLRASMRLTTAEVWTGTDGTVDRVVSVPERGAHRLVLSSEELAVVSRARVSGNAWLAVWMPALLDGREDRMVRVAPVAHSGELLGLLVAERATDDLPFTDEEERVLTELARQVGLALHNVRLDSALQASLDELEIRNEELAASRLRIVSAADESRRSIERNLHDGAQQHLVALAVKVGLIRQLMEADPETAGALVDELRADVQATLTELRDLAHGIYPPLLRERGLGEALRTAANRSVLPTTVVADELPRYPSEIEAAVYFCCLEALQNAGKHAGPEASVVVTLRSTPTELAVTIADDGAGFDPATVVGSHGFVNMADRVGAVGGRLDVSSTPGSGTTISCRLPVEPLS
ncbi:MAG: histidine kinase [Acidimicrobiales bacterium]